MVTIYADTLVCINMFVTYFLLLATQMICRRTLHRLRLLAASALGGLYALTLLLGQIPLYWVVPMRLTACLTLRLAADGFHSLRIFLKGLTVFLLVNFLFAGLMLLLQMMRPDRLMYAGGAVYFDIDIPFLLLSTLAAFFLVQIGVRLSAGKHTKTPSVRITITTDVNTIQCTGILDTGHRLIDPFSGKPVLIVNVRIAEQLVPASLHGFLHNKDMNTYTVPPNFVGKLRLVPFQAVGTQGLLPAFRCNSVCFDSEKKTISKNNVYIAVTESALFGDEADALLPQEIFDELEGGSRNAVQNHRSESDLAAHTPVFVRTVDPLRRHVANTAAAARQKRRSRRTGTFGSRRRKRAAGTDRT